MTAWKPLAVSLLIGAMMATSVQADAISWPSGLDNWTIYLAAPSGTTGSGPISYSVPPAPAAAFQDASAPAVSTAALSAPAVSAPPAPVQPVTQPAPSQPVSLPPAPAPLAASTPPQAAPVQPMVSTPPAPAQPAAVQLPTSVPVVPPQSAIVQPAAYIPPSWSQTTTAMPVTSAPANVANTSLSTVQPAAVAPSTITTAAVAPATVAPATVAPAAMTTAMSAQASVTAAVPVQAFINVGSGPYPQAAAITTGGAQPWYDSTHLTTLFGGQPTTQQIQSFDNAILQRVQQTFNQSGINVNLTENPNTPALHTISVVSNTSSATLSGAIGMTQVGGNGFSFIDHIASSAQSIDQLEWIVAHNVSHELMLAFGVPENYDKSGNYIDAKVANWAMMVNPNSVFSSSAAQAINQALSANAPSSSGSLLGAQEFDPSPAAVPEPTTVAMWSLSAALAFLVSRRRASRRNQPDQPDSRS